MIIGSVIESDAAFQRKARLEVSGIRLARTTTPSAIMLIMHSELMINCNRLNQSDDTATARLHNCGRVWPSSWLRFTKNERDERLPSSGHRLCRLEGLWSRCKAMPKPPPIATSSRLCRFELAAIAELTEPIEPTHSVLHRSAGWMAYHCGQYRKAEQLAAFAWRRNPHRKSPTNCASCYSKSMLSGPETRS